MSIALFVVAIIAHQTTSFASTQGTKSVVSMTIQAKWVEDGTPVVGAVVIDLDNGNQILGSTGSDGKIVVWAEEGHDLRITEPYPGGEQITIVVEDEAWTYVNFRKLTD